jgi:DNA-binding MarR family transcriptional regulator
MSTSSVTALLEKRGFVERYRGAGDRRTVMVRSTGRHEKELAEIMAAFDAEPLSAVRDLLGQLTDASRRFLRRDQTGQPGS